VEIPLSKIIKATQDHFEEVVVFDFAQIERHQKKPLSHGKNIFEEPLAIPVEEDATLDVQASVQRLLLDAERKAQELEEQGYRRGYEQGQKDGYEFGQRSVTIVKEHLERLLHELRGWPEAVFKSYRDWLIEMCLSISRHIVRRELTTDSNQLSQLIDTLLREASAEHTLTVYVHPDDLNLLENNLDLKSLAELSGRTFSLKPDVHLERGGCRLESDIQILDASIEKQFSFIEQVLRNDEPDTNHITT
jgi:flagellar assembly protein FliH